MPITFPSSPSNGQTYTVGARTWTWSGSVWELNANTIATASVGTGQIADNAITTAKIAAGAVAEADIADGAVTTAKIAAGAVVEADIASNAVTAGKLGTDVQLGYRNVITNGAMQVAQRGTSFTFGTGSGTRRFAADRFDTEDYTWSAGSNITISNDTSVVPTGFRASYKVATGATGLTFASGGFLQIRTRIEGYNMQPHHSKMMTLSFWVRSSVTGTYNLFLENGNWGASTTTRAYAPEYTINSANTWEKKTIAVDMSSATSSGTWNTTNGIGLGISWVLGAHSDRTGDSYKSGWTTFSALHGKTSTSVNWATNANATFYLTGVQLEAGSVATPFEFEDYGTTLAKCQRYYWKWTSKNSGDIYHTVYQPASTPFYLHLPMPVTMRARPSSATVSGSWSVINTSASPSIFDRGDSWIVLASSVNPGIGNTNQSGFYSTSPSSTLEQDAEL